MSTRYEPKADEGCVLAWCVTPAKSVLSRYDFLVFPYTHDGWRSAMHRLELEADSISMIGDSASIMLRQLTQDEWDDVERDYAREEAT